MRCVVYDRINLSLNIPKRKQNPYIMTTFEQYMTTEIEKGFIKMIKLEMFLSGKSFEESKKLVKQALKEQGLM